MPDSHCPRIDKFLWAARFFKTRSLATQACNAGHIALNGRIVKPSVLVLPGDTLDIKRPPVTLTIRVINPVSNRVGAKMLPEVYADLTPPDQYELLDMQRVVALAQRQRGTGRPTKKERRDIDDFFGEG